MTVYADSLFLMNFISEYLLLILTEKIISVKTKKYRKAAAAFIGAAASVLIFCMNIPYFLCGLLRAANIILIVCIAYMRNKRVTIHAAPIFAAISFIYSGITASISGIISQDAIIKNGITYISVNETLFAVMFLCTYPVISFSVKLFKKAKNRKIYKITLIRDTHSVTVSALYDSGNLLTDNGKSVVIAQWDTIRSLFEANAYEELYDRIEELKLKVIPYKSLGAESSTVIVFYADRIHVLESNTIFSNIPIGIINRPILSKGGYNALIGKEYI